MIVLSLWLAFACNSGGCYDNQNSLPKAGFYSSENGTAISLSALQIHGIGAPGDSILMKAGVPTSEVYLPMRPAHSTTSWCFHYTQEGLSDPEFNDTVSISYTSRPYFASEECGAMYVYKVNDIRYTTHLIDSIGIVDSLVTNVDAVYWKIYFRTADQPEADDNENPANRKAAPNNR